MKWTRAIMAGAALIFFAAPAWSHEVKNMQHTHAFEKKGYGELRQGHYVNGQNGSIIIWSPNTVNSTNGTGTVEFARPKPITKAPENPFAKKHSDKSEVKYGKKQ